MEPIRIYRASQKTLVTEYFNLKESGLLGCAHYENSKILFLVQKVLSFKDFWRYSLVVHDIAIVFFAFLFVAQALLRFGTY